MLAVLATAVFLSGCTTTAEESHMVSIPFKTEYLGRYKIEIPDYFQKKSASFVIIGLELTEAIIDNDFDLDDYSKEFLDNKCEKYLSHGEWKLSEKNIQPIKWGKYHGKDISFRITDQWQDKSPQYLIMKYDNHLVQYNIIGGAGRYDRKDLLLKGLHDKIKEYSPYPTVDGKKRVPLDKAGFFLDYGRLDIPQYHYEEVSKYFITENRTKELTISFYRVKKGQKPESMFKNMQESMIYSIFAKVISATSFIRKGERNLGERKAEEIIGIMKREKSLFCKLYSSGDYEKKLPKISIEFEAFVDNNQDELIQIWDNILASLECIS